MPTSQPKPTLLLSRSRNLRQHSTDVEARLWQFLRSRKLEGYKFRRQEVIGNYIVDFLCKEYALIVELDGGQHFESKKDQERDKWLQTQGYTILRFWNYDVIENIEAVWDKILDCLSSLTPALSRKRERE